MKVGLGITALIALLPPARANVFVVDLGDGGSGSNYTQVQHAVDVAIDGDVIVVLGGQSQAYAPFLVDGKALSILATSNDVQVLGPPYSIFGGTPAITVTNIATHQEVLVQGFETNFGIRVSDCDGAVWIDDVHATGVVECSSGNLPGASVVASSQVTFTRCSFLGETASDPWIYHDISDGLHVVSSTVQLFDCELEGSSGQNWPTLPGDGGAGIRLEASTVTLQGCSAVGGAGGLDYGGPSGFYCGGNHAVGGAGVHFLDRRSVLRAADSTFTGGAADISILCPALMTGPVGDDVAGPGNVVLIDSPARRVMADGPVFVGGSAVFEIDGTPGDAVFLIASLHHRPLFVAAVGGVLLCELPALDVLDVGVLPANGHADFQVPIPPIGRSSAALTLYAQGVFLEPEAVARLSSGTAVVVLPSGL